MGTKSRALPFQVARHTEIVQSRLTDRYDLFAAGKRSQRFDRRLRRVLIIRMHADAGIDVRVISRELKHTRQLRQIDADAKRVGHTVPGHRVEQLRQLVRELREIDVTVRIDKHGENGEVSDRPAAESNAARGTTGCL